MFRFLTGVLVGAAGLALTAMVANELDQEIKIGDLIQWEVNGVNQFTKPKEVQKIQKTNEGCAYLFVEGTKTGIPVNQATKV